MKHVIQKAEEKIRTMQLGLDLIKQNKTLFEKLDVTFTIESHGISIWCKDDAALVAQTLKKAFDVVFTRRRVTDNCYDWVTEVNSIPVILNMVEYTSSDLTGTLAPL